MAFKSLADYDQEAVCKPGRKVGSNRISGHHFGPGRAAVIRSRGVAAKQGFLMYYTKGDAIGTKVSVRYRESGRLSGVVVKRGSTVCAHTYVCIHVVLIPYPRVPHTWVAGIVRPARAHADTYSKIK